MKKVTFGVNEPGVISSIEVLSSFWRLHHCTSHMAGMGVSSSDFSRVVVKVIFFKIIIREQCYMYVSIYPLWLLAPMGSPFLGGGAVTS